MADIFANCPWCQGRGVPEHRVRRRRGWGSGGLRGPCTFCSVEREKEEKRLAARSRETGEYCDPTFQRYSGPMVHYDVKSGKTITLRSDVQELEGVDAAPPPPWKANCGCCGRKAGDGLWCDDCELHVDSTVSIWDATYHAQYKEDCPFQIPGMPDFEKGWM